MKKDLATIFGLFLLIVVLIVFFKPFTSGTFFLPTQATPSATLRGTTRVIVGDLLVDAKVASKASDRKKGLSGVDSLPLSSGMLFVFENSGEYAFWMKDMKFAIDIIWIDENKRIVTVASFATPEKGKGDDELRLYKPTGAAKYVLEINAGLANLHGLKVGDVVNFEL